MKEPITANIKLNLYGKPVELNLPVSTLKVKPKRMLPVLQTITDRFVDTAVEVFVTDDKEISCKAGCGACCRQPVPLAEIEIYHIAELVENMSEPRRTQIKQKFGDACEKLNEIKWFERLENVYNSDSATKTEEIQALALEYFGQNIACPFLEAESCSIYQDRPLSCREFLVTSPAENCQNPSPENIKHLEMKFKISKIIRQLWKTQNLSNKDTVALIYALEWSKQNPDRFEEKRDDEWLRDFFNYFGKGESSDK